MNSWPGRSVRFTPGSLLARRFAAPHPDAFRCGVAVLDGAVPGERARLTYRLSAVDRYVGIDGVITLNHGSSVLRLRLDDATQVQVTSGTGVKAGHVAVAADEVGSGAKLMLALNPSDLHRFGLDLGA